MHYCVVVGTEPTKLLEVVNTFLLTLSFSRIHSLLPWRERKENEATPLKK